jgi:NTE family protein
VQVCLIFSSERRRLPEMKAESKIAFVLSGGANLGALEVGVLLVLLEHDIRPQILVGTSIGAINAAFFAPNPTLEGARSLEEMWREVSDKVFSQKDYVTAVWRFVRGKSSLYDSRKLRDLLESYFPEGIQKFSDIKAVELYITAVGLHTGELRVFGKDRSSSPAGPPGAC